MRVWLEASLQAGSEAASLQGGSEAATLVFASPGLQAPRDTPVDLRSCQRIPEGLAPDIVSQYLWLHSLGQYLWPHCTCSHTTHNDANKKLNISF